MKSMWFIIVFGLQIINSSEYKKYREMIVGDYICYDDVDISVARITFNEMKESFALTEHSISYKGNEGGKQTFPFTKSNPVLSKKHKTTLDLRDNGNIFIHQEIEKLNHILQVLLKIPKDCKFEQVKESVFTVLSLKTYQKPNPQFTSGEFNQNIFDYNRKFLHDNLKRIFQKPQDTEAMRKKIKDKNIIRPYLSPQPHNQKYPRVLHWGCIIMIFGVFCLLVNHFFLSKPIADIDHDPIHRQKSTDSSFSNKLYVSEDRLNAIYVEPKYLSSSNYSSNILSDNTITIKEYENIMQKRFESATLNTETSNDKLKEKNQKYRSFCKKNKLKNQIL